MVEGGSRSILVAGGGFSGLAVIAELVRQAESGDISIAWLDERGHFGKGVAYGQDDPHYLLNVRADRMGLFAEEPQGFYTWLQEGESLVAADAYVSRALYGKYLVALREKILTDAKEKGISVVMEQARITGASPDSQGLLLTTDRGAYGGGLLVLATGNGDAKCFPWVRPETKTYLPSLWDKGSWDKLSSMAVSHPERPVFLLGSGLTMVDATVRLARELPHIRVLALSRHGLLPCAHSEETSAKQTGWRKPDIALSASALMCFLREEAAQAQALGVPWQHVMDAMRPDTPALWRGLGSDGQRRALRHAISWWNVHRHRIPAPALRLLEQRRANGFLEIVAGRILDVADTADGLEVMVEERSIRRRVAASVMLNCTGPQLDIRRSANPLIMDLYKQGALQPSANGLGVAVTEQGAAKGSWKNLVYPIGPLLAGEDLETTAVPEIRRHAALLARRLLERR
ncbi:MAG: FAD/NAD(P)-binding protein [Alphaproteobacteria bacterium]|nr:FAD/NAD(P)-binding protein [Alphaproteobacteria bacterium]